MLSLPGVVAAAVQARPVPAAPRMVYGAARIPPWRRAPPLPNVLVVAVRAAGPESWPRLFFFLFFFPCLASSSCLVFSSFSCLFLLFLAFFVLFRFFFSFLSFPLSSFLFFVSFLQLTYACRAYVVIDTTCNIYVVVFLGWQSE